MKRIVALAMLAISIGAMAQPPQSETLFTIGNEKISTDEFIKVYTKTSPLNQADFSKESLEEYLDLYVNFRLKVKQSKDMQMDTTSEVLNEFKTYRGKLTPSYMYDLNVLHEAYDHLKKEVHVHHILVKVDQNADAKTWEAALKRATNFNKLLQNKKFTFEQLAADSSGDPSAKDNKGDLGWITGVQTIYAFDSAAYSLPIGKVSGPVKTRFGFHIIKVVEDRPSRGQVSVAHLFVRVPQNATDDDKMKAKNKIDSLYQRMTEGENWDDLVKTYSEDKTTSAANGKLQTFGVGQMVQEFEDAAYGLMKSGDFSQPVKTKFGYHIIKLLEKKPMAEFEKMKDEIRKKVDGGPWKEHSQQAFLKKLKSDYNFTEFIDLRNELRAKMDSSLLTGIWNDSSIGNMNKPVFRLSDSKNIREELYFSQADFSDYIEKNQRKFMNLKSIDGMFNKLYEQYVNTSLTNFEDARLESKYPAFSDLMDEYMNGILLFDLSSDKVWNKAVEDTAGLKAYYEIHKTEWMGEERADITVHTCKNPEVAAQLKKYQAKGMTQEAILAKINKKQKDNLVITHDVVEKGKGSVVEMHEWKAGTEFSVGDSVIQFYKVNEILPPAPKPLGEVKGYVVADYQEYLEDEWIADLKKQYPVTINQQVFQSLIKK